jgi:adenosine deaminase
MKINNTLYTFTILLIFVFLTSCNSTINTHDGKYAPTITVFGTVMATSKDRITIKGDNFIHTDINGEETHFSCKQFENRIELNKKNGEILTIHFYPEGDFDCIEFGMVTWKPEERVPL